MQTLTLDIIAVKPSFEVVVIDDSYEAMLKMAFDWGHEDGTEGVDMRGSEYFSDEMLDSYNSGYQAGVDLRRELEGPSDELTFMDSVLQSLRNGSVQPMARLTLAQMEEIESERIGEDISRNGWAY